MVLWERGGREGGNAFVAGLTGENTSFMARGGKGRRFAYIRRDKLLVVLSKKPQRLFTV